LTAYLPVFHSIRGHHTLQRNASGKFGKYLGLG